MENNTEDGYEPDGEGSEEYELSEGESTEEDSEESDSSEDDATPHQLIWISVPDKIADSGWDVVQRIPTYLDKVKRLSRQYPAGIPENLAREMAHELSAFRYALAKHLENTVAVSEELLDQPNTSKEHALIDQTSAAIFDACRDLDQQLRTALKALNVPTA